MITDTANPTKIHHVKCSFVKPNNFKTKVIDNDGKNGEYWYYNTFDEIGEDIGRCGHCFK